MTSGWLSRRIVSACWWTTESGWATNDSSMPVCNICIYIIHPSLHSSHVHQNGHNRARSKQTGKGFQRSNSLGWNPFEDSIAPSRRIIATVWITVGDADNGWWCRKLLVMQPETERGTPEAERGIPELEQRGSRSETKKNQSLELAQEGSEKRTFCSVWEHKWCVQIGFRYDHLMRSTPQALRYLRLTLSNPKFFLSVAFIGFDVVPLYPWIVTLTEEGLIVHGSLVGQWAGQLWMFDYDWEISSWSNDWPRASSERVDLLIRVTIQGATLWRLKMAPLG